MEAAVLGNDARVKQSGKTMFHLSKFLGDRFWKPGKTYASSHPVRQVNVSLGVSPPSIGKLKTE